MATVTTEHYRTYSPEPFTRADRDTTTILFGGLHWRWPLPTPTTSFTAT